MTETLAFSCLAAFFVFFLYLLPKKKKEMAEKLIRFYGGHVSWPLGVIKLHAKNATYRISRMSRPQGVRDAGPSYPVLWTYVSQSPKTIIGHELSKPYSFGKFVTLPPYETIEENGLKILVGSDDKDIIANLKRAAKEDEAAAALRFLFTHDFHHLTISTEIHFCGLTPKKKNVLRYTGLPEKIYADPQTLQKYFDSIAILIGKLGIRIDSPARADHSI